MKVDSNGEINMNREEANAFSSWLDKNPQERYKRFKEVVHAYLQSKKITG